MPYDDSPAFRPFHDEDEPVPDSGSMFNPFRFGSWSLSSKSDPRWDTFGAGLVGGLTMPEDAARAFVRLKKRLGAPPEDLEYSYTKD